MRIVITGGFGFLGRLVTSALLRTRTFRGAPIDRMVLVDRIVPSEPGPASDPLAVMRTGVGCQEAATAVGAPRSRRPRSKRRSRSSAVVARPVSRPSQIPMVCQPVAKPRSAAAGRPTSQ